VQAFHGLGIAVMDEILRLLQRARNFGFSLVEAFSSRCWESLLSCTRALFMAYRNIDGRAALFRYPVRLC
jgi:hypothetical protein